MGLDNGIMIKLNLQEDHKSAIYFDEMLDSRSYDEVKEICYWRKCWGLRDDIMDYLNRNKTETCPLEDWGPVYELDVTDLFEIYKIIISWQDKKKWNSEGRSIWGYKEIKKYLRNHVRRLSYIIGLLQNEEINKAATIFFYDSY